MRTRLRVLASLLAAGALAGCYRYAPLSTAPTPGLDVRLRLTGAGAAALAPRLGADRTTVAGRVLAANDTAVVLAVTETDGPGGRAVWPGDPVTIPRSAFGSAERRTLDKGRTLLVGAATVGGAAVLVALIRAIGSAASGGDDGGTVVVPP